MFITHDTAFRKRRKLKYHRFRFQTVKQICTSRSNR